MSLAIELGPMHPGEQVFIIVGLALTLVLVALFAVIVVMAFRSERRQAADEAADASGTDADVDARGSGSDRDDVA